MHAHLATVQLAFALFVQAPQVEIEREAWPNGSPKLEREVVRNSDGTTTAQGSCRAWHENGRPATEGRYSNGLRAGEWQTWYANGQLSSKGRFLKDHRDGKWSFWRDDGTENQVDSGRYTFEELTYASKHTRCAGELRDGERHGAWTFRWPSGQVQVEATYKNGQLHGECVFRHSDGSAAWWIVSGNYDNGARASMLTAERWRALRGDEKPPRSASAIDAEFATSKGTHAVRALRVARLLDELAADDMSTAKGAKAAHARANALRLVANGHWFGWREGNQPEDAEFRREVLRSWATLWELERDDGAFWEFALDVRDQADQRPSDVLMFPRVLELNAKELEIPAALAGRFAQQRSAASGGASGDQARIDALAWLVAHQSPDGSWDCDGFSEQCGKLGNGRCSDGGADLHDVGVSALALLALLGDGNTFDRGIHAQAVVKGVGWLLDHQREDGLVGEPFSSQFLYDHAYATIALCEASALSSELTVKRAAQRALTFAYRAQNPTRGWRYSVPPNGDNDTSVSGVMLVALGVARLCGLEVEERRIEWGLGWLDEMTDPETGRCGYTERGSATARLAETVNRFPAKYSEAMTALALTARYLVTPRAGDTQVISKSARLLVEKLPRWHADAGTNDFYYWFWGSQALFQNGGESWRKWNAALRDAVVNSQRHDGDSRGSWDPVDPWGAVGGRVYSTALMALSLETPVRYTQPAPPPKKR